MVRAARFAHPPGRLGDGDQLGRRPLALRVAQHSGLVEVLTESTGVLEELARGDPVGSWKVGQETVDPGVEVEAAFVGELQHDDRDEGLGGAADVPRHVGIDGAARRVDGRRAGGDLGDRAVMIEQRDAGTDELACGVVRVEDAA